MKPSKTLKNPAKKTPKSSKKNINLSKIHKKL
jgi:hypothetical protein